MATTAVKKPKTRTDLVHRSRMGPFSIATAVVGTVVGGVTFAALVAGSNFVLHSRDSNIDLSKAWDKAWDEMGRRGSMLLAAALVVSYLLATFVAGRMAWRRGWLRGLESDIDLRDRRAATDERLAPIERRTADCDDDHGTSNGNGNGNGANVVDIDGMTRDELYEMAQELDISGRSSMTKEDLARSVRRKRRALSRPRSRS